MTRERSTQGGSSRRRETQPLNVGACTCFVQRATVGEDHFKDCPLYRQRGSGISVLHGPRANSRVGW
jgi:hypothetical protein